MQLEGFEFVMEMVAHAMYLRHHVGACKHLTKWITRDALPGPPLAVPSVLSRVPLRHEGQPGNGEGRRGWGVRRMALLHFG